MNTITFMKTLKNIVDVIEFYGGSISSDPALLQYEKDIDSKNNITGITNKEYEIRVQDKMLAIGALCRADKNMYLHILHDMRNQYQLGNDCYPGNLTKAFDLLQNYHSPTARTESSTSSSTNALQFSQRHQLSTPSIIVPGKNGKVYPRIKCAHCGHMGHYNDFCTKIVAQQHALMADIDLDPDSDSDYESICAEFIFAHQFSNHHHTDKHQGCILLYSGSSCSVFCDDSFLTNI